MSENEEKKVRIWRKILPVKSVTLFFDSRFTRRRRRVLVEALVALGDWESWVNPLVRKLEK